jgi:hypothetical protein
MTTDLQIEIANAILATGLVTKVFHSCQLLREESGTQLYPVYPRGQDFVYVGPDDTKGFFAYIRSNGDLAMTPLKVGGCGTSYDVLAPMRVVFFHDGETRSHEDLLTKLSTFAFRPNVALQRIITDKFRLLREESDLYRPSFDAKTFYTAFDVSVNLVLLQSDCGPNKVCAVHPNPICL